MERETAILLLRHFFEEFEESNLYEEYKDCENITDEQYEAAWAALERGPVEENRAAFIHGSFADYPVVIAIRDDLWDVLNDAYDNDPTYYGHHYLGDGIPDYDGFVPRGNHYIVVFISKQGEVNIDVGYHKHELPARAFVMGG